jgi:hypothetical protein
MRFEELNWFDVENYLENDDRIMLVFGACEQHGYLSLLTDSKIPLAMADILGPSVCDYRLCWISLKIWCDRFINKDSAEC